MDSRNETARMGMKRKASTSDRTDDECPFVARYVTLKTEDSPQLLYPLREVFSGLRYSAMVGTPWCLMPIITCSVVSPF
jgi:hypothetical protein